MSKTLEEAQLDLTLKLIDLYFDQQAQVNQQKNIIQMQGKLLNSCMERIMSLEGRVILGNFNQRLEHLEAYFRDEPQEEENKSGNSSFEAHEMHRTMGGYYNGYVPEDTAGTHPPECRCPYCEPQEGVIEVTREDY
jgi:hypothetical protein